MRSGASRRAERWLGRLAGRAGLTDYNRVLARSLVHARWLYQAKDIPTCPLVFSEPSGDVAADIPLCERLIAAYRRADEARPGGTRGRSGVWKLIHDARSEELCGPLGRGDARGLAVALGSMFVRDFLYGIASASLVREAKTRLGARIWSLKYLDGLVSLAEALGVVRAECPEQGLPGYALADGLDALAAKVERAAGIPIGFPDVGAPYGIRAGGALVTMESPEHIYVALRIKRFLGMLLGPADAPRLVEIGAGFGGTASWLLRLLGSAGDYTIIDLPLSNVAQGYFLAKVFGEGAVSLLGEDGPGDGRLRIRVLPDFIIDDLRENFDVLINENSMPEIPAPAVARYFDWARGCVTGLYYGYNQEAYSPVDGVPQTDVPEAVRASGGFELLMRNPSWLRPGYVEEVYRAGAGPRPSALATPPRGA